MHPFWSRVLQVLTKAYTHVTTHVEIWNSSNTQRIRLCPFVATPTPITPLGSHQCFLSLSSLACPRMSYKWIIQDVAFSWSITHADSAGMLFLPQGDLLLSCCASWDSDVPQVSLCSVEWHSGFSHVCTHFCKKTGFDFTWGHSGEVGLLGR